MFSETIFDSIIGLFFINFIARSEYYGINVLHDSNEKLESENEDYSNKYNKDNEKELYFDYNLTACEKDYNNHVYNKDIFDFDKSGYNIKGVDRGNMSVPDYLDEILGIEHLLQNAHFQMKKRQFGYALRDIRIGLEKGVKCVILHWLGESYIRENLDDNIAVCKNYSLLSNELVNQLYSAKKHCNDIQHDTNLKKEYGQVHFTYKVLEKLNDEIKSFI